MSMRVIKDPTEEQHGNYLFLMFLLLTYIIALLTCFCRTEATFSIVLCLTLILLFYFLILLLRAIKDSKEEQYRDCSFIMLIFVCVFTVLTYFFYPSKAFLPFTSFLCIAFVGACTIILVLRWLVRIIKDSAKEYSKNILAICLGGDETSQSYFGRLDRKVREKLVKKVIWGIVNNHLGDSFENSEAEEGMLLQDFFQWMFWSALRIDERGERNISEVTISDFSCSYTLNEDKEEDRECDYFLLTEKIHYTKKDKKDMKEVSKASIAFISKREFRSDPTVEECEYVELVNLSKREEGIFVALSKVYVELVNLSKREEGIFVALSKVTETLNKAKKELDEIINSLNEPKMDIKKKMNIKKKLGKVIKYLNDPEGVILRGIIKNPDKAKEYLAAIMKYPDKAKNYLDTILKDTVKAKHYLDTVMKYSDIAKEYLDAIINSPDKARNYFDMIIKHPKIAKACLDAIIKESNFIIQNIEEVWKSLEEVMKDLDNPEIDIITIKDKLEEAKKCLSYVKLDENDYPHPNQADFTTEMECKSVPWIIRKVFSNYTFGSPTFMVNKKPCELADVRIFKEETALKYIIIDFIFKTPHSIEVDLSFTIQRHLGDVLEVRFDKPTKGAELTVNYPSTKYNVETYTFLNGEPSSKTGPDKEEIAFNSWIYPNHGAGFVVRKGGS